MKRTITALLVVGLLAVPAAATASEEGATFFEDGSCQEADGTPGTSMIDGKCLTIADYDYLYSFENLDTIQSLTDPTQSIAAEAGITAEDNPASERILGAGLVADGQERTFADKFAPTGWATNPFDGDAWLYTGFGWLNLRRLG